MQNWDLSGWKDDSTAKGTYQMPRLRAGAYPWDPHGRQRELVPTNCPDLYTLCSVCTLILGYFPPPRPFSVFPYKNKQEPQLPPTTTPQAGRLPFYSSNNVLLRFTCTPTLVHSTTPNGNFPGVIYNKAQGQVQVSHELAVSEKQTKRHSQYTVIVWKVFSQTGLYLATIQHSPDGDIGTMSSRPTWMTQGDPVSIKNESPQI